MRIIFPALLVILTVVQYSYSCDSVLIGAFNIKVFGPTKAGKDDIMDVITKIVAGYDLILIQEIRDASGVAITKLMNLLNQTEPGKFALEISDRLGRTSSKEEYAYIYNTDVVTFHSNLTYDDTMDDFEREPFSISVTLTKTGHSLDLVLTGLHTKPTEAFEELQAMDDVYEDTRSHFNTENILILGDLNADCNYLTGNEKSQTNLFTNSTFLNVIGNDADTTTSSTDCAYDRIILTGDLRNHAYVAGVHHFQTDLGLNDTMMGLVSDHFPVFLNITL